MARSGWVAVLVGLGGGLFGRPALAQECSPEDWFCDAPADGDAAPEDDAVEDPSVSEGPPKKRRSKRPPVAPPAEPTACQPAAPVIVEVKGCAEAPSPEVPPEALPAEEALPEEDVKAVGFGLVGLLRYVGGSEGRGGALLGGGAAFLRLRPIEEVAFDVGFAAMGGPENLGRSRVEVSGFTDLLWYPLIGDVRAYFVLGGEVVGASSSWETAAETVQVSYEYVAPRGGLGMELGGSDWAVFLDGIVAPRFPTNEAASNELRGDDFRTTVQLRSGLVAFW
jgi:hypothetical protein